MKKLITTMLLLGAVSAFAEGTDMYLYWMIDSSDSVIGSEGQHATIKVAAYTDGTPWEYGSQADYLNLYWDTGSGISGSGSTSLTADDVTDMSSVFAQLGNFGSGYSYFVELYNDSNDPKSIYARSTDAMSYSALLNYIGEMKTSGMVTPSSSYGVTGFTAAAVPEPTSGLLLLLGVAGLALRRKNKKA